MYRKFSQWMAAASVRWPWAFLLLAVLLTAISVQPSMRLFKNIKTDFASLLPENTPSVKRVEAMSERFGSTKNLIVVFDTQHKEAIIGMLPELAEALKKVPQVEKIRYEKPGYDFFNDHKFLYPSLGDLEQFRDKLDRRIQREKLGGLLIDLDDEENGAEAESFDALQDKFKSRFGGNIISRYLTNKEETVFLMEVYPPAEAGINIGFARDFYERISKAVEDFNPKRFDPQVQILYSGGIRGLVDEYSSLMRDLKVANIISWSAVVALLLLYFSHVGLTLIALIPLLIGLLWTFGVAALIVGQLNMITAFLFSILTGLGIDIGIHFSSRYCEERRAGKSQLEATEAMLTSTGRATVTAVITTVAAFLVQIVNDFRGFADFGWIAGLGLLIIFAAYTMILGPFVIVLERLRLLHISAKTATHPIHPLWFIKKWDRMRYVRPILGISLLLFVVSGWIFWRHIDFNFNFSSLKTVIPESRLAREKTFSVYQSSSIPAMFIAPNGAEALRAKKVIEEKMKGDATPTIEGVQVLGDLVPTGQEEKLPVIAQIRRLLEDELMNKMVKKPEDKKRLEDAKRTAHVQPFTLEEIPQEVKQYFYGKKRVGEEQFVFIRPLVGLDLEDGKNSVAFANDTRDIGVGETTYHAVSNNLIFADLTTLMLRDSKRAVLFAFAAVFVLLWIDFKKMRHAFLVILPLVFGVFWMFCGMKLFDVQFNMFNMIVMPSILGMGIDHSVYVYHRVREIGVQNVIDILWNVGAAIFMAVITTIAGFGGMVFAHHNGLRSFGILAIIGLTTTLLSALLFFPALLQWLHSGAGHRKKNGPFSM